MVRSSGMSVAARVDGDHVELRADAVERLRQARPADQQRFIRMQRRGRGRPVDLDELRRPRG
jgi:hypothetical protein